MKLFSEIKLRSQVVGYQILLSQKNDTVLNTTRDSCSIFMMFSHAFVEGFKPLGWGIMVFHGQAGSKSVCFRGL